MKSRHLPGFYKKRNRIIIFDTISLFFVPLIVVLILHQSSTRGHSSEKTEAIVASGGCNLCDIPNSDFTRVEFSGFDFCGARLDGSNFSLADLSGADFRFASLRGVVFNGTDLSHANFTGADYSGVSFTGAYLQDAIFHTLDKARNYGNIGSKSERCRRNVIGTQRRDGGIIFNGDSGNSLIILQKKKLPVFNPAVIKHNSGD